MKKKLIFVTIVLCTSAHLNTSAYNRQDFVSTAEIEEREHRGFTDDARLTHAQEERERLGRVDDARLTSREEEKGRIGRKNYASATEAAEMRARY